MTLFVARIAALALAACGWGDTPDEYWGAEFVAVSAGGYHTCGVRTDGSVACWGWNEFGSAMPPEGEWWIHI